MSSISAAIPSYVPAAAWPRWQVWTGRVLKHVGYPAARWLLWLGLWLRDARLRALLPIVNQ